MSHWPEIAFHIHQRCGTTITEVEELTFLIFELSDTEGSPGHFHWGQKLVIIRYLYNEVAAAYINVLEPSVL